MGVVKGVNAGFVTVAPTDDPAGANTYTDTYARAFKDTAPVGAVKVTEIGWWCDNATEAADFDVGIYDHNVGDNNPEAIVGVSRNNAKGTTAGWKKVIGLNIPITAETIYWIAFQLDDTSTTTFINRVDDAGEKIDYKSAQTSLPAPWGVSNGSEGRIYCIYAVWEAEAVGTNMQINIADAWKDVDSMKINIGDVWKDVAEVKQNIGDAWKTVY